MSPTSSPEGHHAVISKLIRIWVTALGEPADVFNPNTTNHFAHSVRCLIDQASTRTHSPLGESRIILEMSWSLQIGG